MNGERAPAALAALADDYEIGRELGRGGTAVVYLARERATNAQVAIKLIRAQFADDPEASARLAREARFVAQLDHPNIVPVRAVLDLGDAGIALVMAHVAGRTLKEILREQGPLPPARAEALMRDVARALGAAHAMGIVHRDVKPENVFVDESGRAVLADFGIARSMSSEAQQLTMTGVAIGTPTYMAPEQIDGAELDGRADIYSLGLVAWEMLAGRRPWAGEALYSVLYHQKHVQLADLRELRPELPAPLASAIAGAIEKERDARWPDIHTLVEALDGDIAPRAWPATVPVSTNTVQVERAGLPLPVESVVAIDWRGFERAAPLAPIAPTARYSRRWIALGGVVAALLVGALVISAVRSHSTASATEMSRTVPTATAVQDGTPVSGSMAPMQERIATGEVVDTTSHGVLGDSPKAIALAASMPTASAKVAAPVSSAPIAALVTSEPAARPPSSARVRVVAGGRHSCLLAEDGRAYCWGGNDRGQLGTSGTTRLGAPATAVAGARFVALASGMSHSCAIARGGAAWCWGDNDNGQLGDGTTSTRLVPSRVAGGRAFSAISAGSAHSCALSAGGTAWCWGSSANGQLGDGAAADRPTPVRVAGNHRFASIAAGWIFTCGLDTAGIAWCWGDDTARQHGDSASTSRRTPVLVRGAPAFTAIAAGSAHACGVTALGSAYCWGSNSSGQLGDGTTATRPTPVRVRSTASFVAITTGAVHSCALTTGGEAYCWGRNTYGQLGDGSNDDHLLPVRVAGDHVFTGVRAFGSHTCGVTASGETFCWGYNLDGQLGDGTRTHRARPVYVERPAVR